MTTTMRNTIIPPNNPLISKNTLTQHDRRTKTASLKGGRFFIQKKKNEMIVQKHLKQISKTYTKHLK